MPGLNVLPLAAIILASPIWPISAKESCPPSDEVPRNFFVGNKEVNVFARYGFFGSRFSVIHKPSEQEADPARSGHPKSRRYDLTGLPLDAEFPETVNPEVRNGVGGPPENGSWSTVFLDAIAASPAALELLRNWGDPKRPPPASWNDH